ncbi:DnaB-like helicase C-terminal domain-containing protein [Streptomyces bohaiensis]|uniref:DnaB-like helicase C-terminal domain-containing protein n=1 Tax=Streptomyces bohaiensis TaxID=1431344 RepID=UPI003B80F6E6
MRDPVRISPGTTPPPRWWAPPARPVRRGRCVWLCALEGGRDAVTTRVPAAESSVPLRHLHTGSTTEREEQRLARAVVDIDAAPLRVFAPVALTLRELAVQARRLHGEQALRLLAVDGPDELLLAAGRPRAGEGAEVLRALRRLARGLQIPVVATAALDQSRAPDRRPAPTDLRESDGVLRTADLVLLLHRTDAYRQRIPLAGEAELTLAKHRRGLTGRLVIAHQGHRGRFVDVPDGPRFSAHGAEEAIEDGVADTTPKDG